MYLFASILLAAIVVPGIYRMGTENNSDSAVVVVCALLLGAIAQRVRLPARSNPALVRDSWDKGFGGE
jgi:hypothetical protein